ncbi:MAG: IS1634 family transposase [Bdellovibrionales bacterium]|nr:IS1634 family transposase [Bdellovibrionales bacterium]
MSDKPITEVEEFDHLGLVAALFKDYGLTDKIDKLLPKLSNNQKINHSQAIQCMIYQGLGFSDRRLYSAKRFFAAKPIETLLGRGVDLDMLNDDVLGRSLDAIHAYGPSKFFSDLAFSTLLKNELVSKFVHMDSTSHSFFGRKYSKDSGIEVRYGHSKGRKDLTQLVQLLITTDQGIPFWSKTYSGNANDREIFQQSVQSVNEYFKTCGFADEVCVVSDSALYSKKFLLNRDITGSWMARVPESIKRAKQLVESDHKKTPWIKINQDYKYREESVSYGGKRQRWIIVNNREARYKELSTLQRNLDKEERLLERKTKSLMNTVFQSRETLNSEFKRIVKQHPLFQLRKTIIGHYKKRRGKKRPNQSGYKVIIGFSRHEKLIKRFENKKGKFIIGTNFLDPKLTPERIIEVYCGRNQNIEGCFKFIKDSSFRLNEVFLKRVDRIESLMAIMALSLFVNNLGQLKLRQALKAKQLSLPSQNGKRTQRPTLKWVFQTMRNVIKVRVNIFGRVYEEFKGLDASQRIIIECFGPSAKMIYGSSP